MRARSQRLVMVAVAGVVLVAAVGLALVALRDAIVLFYSPSEVAAEHPGIGERIRIGGLVEEGSVERPADGGANFVVTDGAATIRVTYSGSLPDLFREGQGVVAEGAFVPSGDFAASSVLAKHDETYMPPEVAEALRDSGVWQGEDGE
ncbi:cytochrome c maturation protein CcmE [Hyphobacterium sp. CCMP332]|jgi:cytochrome c-type biogenesis protein CcmE|uniref:cytochrome c maturation protein CcmE n=1 Tax=Hyphobacterium sp. CCMP332 TaxID=2749086 RepID=UPI00164F6099|nr:cytochrome c maturation protein CcmE [Hyphobacterium sp. CCMP332]QNL19133.1 cytochrome c maturation protein CcmE [Hyphobacterium sp. CCMP332]